MKQAILATLMLVVVSASESNAQLLNSYGFKAALTSADQKYELKYYDSELKTRRRVGFNIAVFLEWLDVPYFSLLTQVEYTQRGMGRDFFLTGSSGPDDIVVTTFYSRLDYLSIPVIGKLRIQTETITPFIFAGPRVDFLLSYSSDEGAFNSVYDKFEKTALGGSFGIGVQTETLLPVSISVEVRYNVDFTDSYSTDFLQVRNSAFDIWLGVAF